MEWSQRYQAWRERHMPSTRELAAIREAGRARASALAPAAREAYLKTHGLLLPDHLFEFWGFWLGLTPAEYAGLGGTVGISPVGVCQLLELERFDVPTIDGLDPRLLWRFYSDPPEFLTLLSGDSDGLHWGLWYDDPREPPPFVASFYSRDGDIIRVKGRTVLEAVRRAVADALDGWEPPGPGEAMEYEPGRPKRYMALRLADDALAETGADVPDEAEAYALQACRFPTLDGLGVAAPGEQPEERELADAVDLHGEDLEAAVAQALAWCAEGRPIEALALGRDLHWTSDRDGEREAAAARLLAAAYEALGRTALADVVRVHHANRDLSGVDILDADPE